MANKVLEDLVTDSVASEFDPGPQVGASSNEDLEWKCIYKHFPKVKVDEFVQKNSPNDYKKDTLVEMGADGVYEILGGELNKFHKAKNPNWHNSCALKLSIALIKCGMKLNPKEAVDKNGNGVIASAINMRDFLIKKLPRPSYNKSFKNNRESNASWNEISLLQGIVVMIPRDAKKFGASGHVTIYSYELYRDMIFKPTIYLDDISQIIVWELN